MVKVFALIPQRPDISREEFHSHWIAPHGEMATGIDTLKRYVQCHRLRPGIEGIEETEYEGIAEVWFDDVETAAAMGEHPVYAEKVNPDEPNFIDVDRLTFLFTDETVLHDGPSLAADADTVKALLLVRRAGELSPEEFGGHWTGAHAARAEEAFPRAIRHVLAVGRAENHAEGEPRADGIEEIWWTDRASFDADWSEGGEAYLKSLEDVAASDATTAMLAEEVRLIWP